MSDFPQVNAIYAKCTCDLLFAFDRLMRTQTSLMIRLREQHTRSQASLRVPFEDLDQSNLSPIEALVEIEAIALADGPLNPDAKV